LVMPVMWVCSLAWEEGGGGTWRECVWEWMERGLESWGGAAERARGATQRVGLGRAGFLYYHLAPEAHIVACW
jgi:hypothetical protein